MKVGDAVETMYGDSYISTYSSSFIGSIVKAVPPDSLVILELSTDMPIKLSFMGLLDTQDTGTHIVFFIAPRIETE